MKLQRNVTVNGVEYLVIYESIHGILYTLEVHHEGVRIDDELDEDMLEDIYVELCMTENLMVSSEMWRAVHRMEDAARKASDAADRVEEASRRMAQLLGALEAVGRNNG